MGHGRQTRNHGPGLAVGVFAKIMLVALLSCRAGAQAREMLHRTAPDYPPLAAKMRVSGTVSVLASIDTEGNVTEAHATAGHALLRQAAEKAVLQSKFAAGGKPTETTIQVQFQMNGASAH